MSDATGSMRIAAEMKNLRVIAEWRCALRFDRKRGLTGHWTYDPSRHARKLACYRDLVKRMAQSGFP